LKNRIKAEIAPANPMSQPTGYGRIRTPHHIECPLRPPIPPNGDLSLAEIYCDGGTVESLSKARKIGFA
jgi:hypothetical protein